MAIVAARDSSIWVAYTNRLSRIRDGRVQEFTTANGLSSDRLLSLYDDHHGVVWVETSAGIDRFVEDRFIASAKFPDAVFGQGRFGFGEDHLRNLFAFAPPRGTFQVERDRLIPVPRAPQITGMAASREDLWFCGGGINCAEPDSLQKWIREPDEPADYTRFGRADGLNRAQCSDGSRNMAIASNGKLWVATDQGLAMVESSRFRRSFGKPAIYMEKVVVGRAVQNPGHELVIPAGAHHVALHFGAIELSSP